MSKWLKPSEYARREGISRRKVWTYVEKGALDVLRSAPKRRGVRGSLVRVRDRERTRKVDG